VNPDPYFLAERQADRREYDSATQIWETLSKEGDCDATWQLGLVHFMGYGTQQDARKGVEFWLDAAARGQPRAQIALADVYFRNPNTWIVCSDECGGILADLVVAYRWYLIAERDATFETDKQYLSRAIRHARAALSIEQKRDVEDAAAKWVPTPTDCKPRRVM
jgi:hypothetical protein